MQDDQGQTHKVRLLGMDAPESCQDHGQAATAALQALVLGRRVQVRPQQNDDYGRLLARLYLPNKTDVGRHMVRQGHAWSYRYRQDPGPYWQEEQRAQAAGLGLFAQSQAMRPRDFRQSHGSCHSAQQGAASSP